MDQFTFPPTVLEASLLSTPSPAFVVYGFFNDNHSDLCEVVAHCSFDLHFSNNCQRLFLGGSDGKSICPQCRRPGFNPWVGKTSWRRKWQPTPVFLPGKSHGWRSLVGYSSWGRKGSDTTDLTFCVLLGFVPALNTCNVFRKTHENHAGTDMISKCTSFYILLFRSLS